MEYEVKIATLLKSRVISGREAERIRKIINKNRGWSCGVELMLSNGSALYINVKGNKYNFLSVRSIDSASFFDNMKFISYSFVGAVMYLSIFGTAYSEPVLPLIGEQSISVDEKVCIYGSAGRVAAIRMLSDDECFSRLVKRPVKSGRVIIETEQIFGDAAERSSDPDNSDGFLKTGKSDSLH